MFRLQTPFLSFRPCGQPPIQQNVQNRFYSAEFLLILGLTVTHSRRFISFFLTRFIIAFSISYPPNSYIRVHNTSIYLTDNSPLIIASYAVFSEGPIIQFRCTAAGPLKLISNYDSFGSDSKRSERENGKEKKKKEVGNRPWPCESSDAYHERVTHR